MIDDDSTIEVHRHLEAEPRRVFCAFAEAQMIAQWMKPAREIELTVLHFDFRRGGGYRFAYLLPDGRTVAINGVFRSVEPPSKIVFSWLIEPPDEHAGIDSEVIVTITPAGRGTRLLIQHKKLALPDAAARHAEGWRGALDLLGAVLNH